MHQTNVLGYRNRYHPRYPAPSFWEVRMFQGDVERVERSKSLLTEKAGVTGGSLNHAGKVLRHGWTFFDRY